jgi:DNA polymerase I
MVGSLPKYIKDPDPSIYFRGSYTVLDFETTNRDKGSALTLDNRIVLGCWKEVNSHATRQYRWGGELDMQALLESIDRTDFIVAHNAKFDLQWLVRCGYDLASKPVFDTMVGEWVIAGNRQFGKMASLDSCLKRRSRSGKTSIVSKLIKSGVCPSDIPRSLLLEYCRKDVEDTEFLMLNQREQMAADGTLPVMYTRCLATPVLADLETVGLHLDAAVVEGEYANTVLEFVDVNIELENIVGSVNMNSPKQLGEFIYDTLKFPEPAGRDGRPLRTPSGGMKTDKDTLSLLVPETEEQKRFLSLRKKQAKLSNALSKNLELFVGACREQDSTIYAVYNQCIAGTHRLTSSGRPTKYNMFDKPKGCQFHNLPRKYKSLFSARRDGWVIVEADYSQLEFRVAGHLGNDSVIAQDISNKVDVHTHTADTMTKAGQTISRQAAKSRTFKPLFGGMSGTPAEVAYYKSFQSKYNQLYKTQTRWTHEVLNTKHLVTEYGMIYYWPDTKISSSGYISNTTQIFNYPIQGLATAEIVPTAVVHLWHRIRDMDAFLTNTVHDSVIAETPPWELEAYQAATIQAFTHDVYAYLHKCYDTKMRIPLGVSFRIGKNWGMSDYSDDELIELSRELSADFVVNISDGEVQLDVEPQY